MTDPERYTINALTTPWQQRELAVYCGGAQIAHCGIWSDTWQTAYNMSAHIVAVHNDSLLTTNTAEHPDTAAMRYIELLRSDFGTVTFLPNNEEAETKAEQFAIDCCGDWTNWQDQRFYGESFLQCLAKAVTVMDRSAELKGGAA